MLKNNYVDLTRYPMWLLKWNFKKADYDESGTLDIHEAMDNLLRFNPKALREA